MTVKIMCTGEGSQGSMTQCCSVRVPGGGYGVLNGEAGLTDFSTENMTVDHRVVGE